MACLKIDVDPTGSVQISAYCLKTDTWEGFEHFLESSQADGDNERVRNRNLRAAVFNLFAHFEAVVADVGLSHLSKRECRKSFFERVQLIAKKSNVPMPLLQGRNMRNSITHPGGSTDDALPFEQLTAESAQQLARDIGVWLDHVCSSLDVERFSDTQGAVVDYSRLLGSTDTPRPI